MQLLRRLLAQRTLAALICAAALLLRLVVPTGYMIATQHGQLAITLCPGVVPQPAMAAMPHMHGGKSGHDQPKEHGRSEMPCAFSGLSASLLGAVDPLLLVALVAFIMALGVRPAIPPAPRRAANLRPPLRGPPLRL